MPDLQRSRNLIRMIAQSLMNVANRLDSKKNIWMGGAFNKELDSLNDAVRNLEILGRLTSGDFASSASATTLVKGTTVKNLSTGRTGTLKSDITVEDPEHFFGADGTEMAVVVEKAQTADQLQRKLGDQIVVLSTIARALGAKSGDIDSGPVNIQPEISRVKDVLYNLEALRSELASGEAR